MALYLVSYDIKSYDKDEYPKLWQTLETLGAVKILFSEWVIVENEGKATALYNQIAPCTIKSDRLLVQEITRDAYWDKLLISDDEFDMLLKNARG
jgi:CRISPR-associated endonuclease Cas2